jgi:hypothetical protein
VLPPRPAIIVSIDQYAEAALGNRGYFLNRPYGIGGSKGDPPWLGWDERCGMRASWPEKFARTSTQPCLRFSA